MSKSRPVVIVSREELLAVLETVTICPLTSHRHPTWRSRLAITVGARPGEIAVDQIRTISKARLGRRIGQLEEREATTLRRIITEMYGE